MLNVKRIIKSVKFLMMFLVLLSFTGQAPIAAAEQSQDFGVRVTLNGDNARITMPDSITFGDSPVSALNLRFKTPYNSDYRIVVTKYASYNPSLPGARQYFSISPEFNLKNASSIEIKSSTPIDVYQLYNNGWRRLAVQVSGNTYKAQISSLGVFAVKDGAPLQVSVNQNHAQSTSWKDKIQQKDYEVYNNYVIPFFNNLESMLKRGINQEHSLFTVENYI